VAASRRSLGLLALLGRGLGERSGGGLRVQAKDAADVGLLALVDAAEGGAGEAADALFFIESARAAILAEEIAHRDALREARVPGDLRDLEAMARLRAAALQQTLGELLSASPAPLDAIAKTQAALDHAYADLDRAVARMQREVRHMAAAELPAPVGLAALQRRLAPDAAMVLYQIARERVLALVVRQQSARLVALGDAAAVERRAGTWRAFLSNPGPETAAAEHGLASQLHDLMVADLVPELHGVRRVCVSPDGALTFLPFEALASRASGRRLAEDHELSYVPSATVAALLLAEVSGRAEGRGLLAVGDPVYPGETLSPSPSAADVPLLASARRDIESLQRLPGTAAEVEDLAKMFATAHRADPSCKLLRAAATLTAVRTALAATAGRLRVVHFACHGVVRDRWPALSGLVLSGGEVLSTVELASLPLPADLAVFSACNTGAGELQRGEGLLGLVRAGIIAGCPRLVVSHWKVEDQSTRSFMHDFYRRLLIEGSSPSAALQATRCERLRSRTHAHPFHWAAFALWSAPD
jgi:CHAT domain-containing protein